MRIVVCIKEAIDSQVNPDFLLSNKSLWQKGTAYRLNKDDANALKMALDLKIGNGYEVIAVSIGSERTENCLRDALVNGVDKAVRIWDKKFDNLNCVQKAKILSKCIFILGADLVFTGAKSIDTNSGILGSLIAGFLSLPYISNVIDVSVENSKRIVAIRNVDKGVREKIASNIPVVLSVTGNEAKIPYSSLEDIIDAHTKEIRLFSLADLGIDHTDIYFNEKLVSTSFCFPSPRLKKVPSPDTSLPTFDRILKLLEGGISKRRATMLSGSTDELVDQLVQILLDNNVISVKLKN